VRSVSPLFVSSISPPCSISPLFPPLSLLSFPPLSLLSFPPLSPRSFPPLTDLRAVFWQLLESAPRVADTCCRYTSVHTCCRYTSVHTCCPCTLHIRSHNTSVHITHAVALYTSPPRSYPCTRTRTRTRAHTHTHIQTGRHTRTPGARTDGADGQRTSRARSRAACASAFGEQALPYGHPHPNPRASLPGLSLIYIYIYIYIYI
jgi:hypothetical protein